MQFEADLHRNPYNIKSWLRYIEYLTLSDPPKRWSVFEKSVKFLPRSYKLWFAYLTDRSKEVSKPDGESCVKVARTFERALIHMNKMPKIWSAFTFIFHLIDDMY